MSTLRVNNITDTSGGSSSLSVPGAAEAWVNFNGTGTIAIRASFNVSSITDGGVGTYTVNFTNALVDANNSTTVGFNNLGYPTQWFNVEAGTASSVGVYGYIASGGTAYLSDCSRVCVTVHR